MADNIGNKAAHDYHLDVAPVTEGFFVKGASHCDWGMKNRISRLFSNSVPEDSSIEHLFPEASKKSHRRCQAPAVTFCLTVDLSGQKISRAARMICSISPSVWTAERNMASN